MGVLWKIHCQSRFQLYHLSVNHHLKYCHYFWVWVILKPVPYGIILLYLNLICLILTTSMAGMVRNPAKTMDKKTKLAGWLFPIPTRWCNVSGNSLDSSSVVIFHTVSRMNLEGSYNLSRRSGGGWTPGWKIWTEECEKH